VTPYIHCVTELHPLLDPATLEDPSDLVDPVRPGVLFPESLVALAHLVALEDLENPADLLDLGSNNYIDVRYFRFPFN
jgi:hypothetical protein